MQRNINNLIGYRIGATDGEIGKVEEFYFDDETWTIRYLIVLTGNWLANRKVLISPEVLVRDAPAFRSFPVNLACEQIRNSPDIDTDKPVSVPGPPAADLHLRSSRQVTGYNLHTTDGEIGHIIDFILDDETWQVLYLVVDTHRWFGGKKVLIGVNLITAVQWDNSKVFVDITTDALKGSTIFVESKFLHPETGIPLTQGNPNIHLN
jgi:uncharacterized protein YrrD